MNTCTRHIEFAKQSTVALALWVSIFLTFCFLQTLCDIHDDFDFDIVNFPFLGGDVPRHPLMECIFLNL